MHPFVELVAAVAFISSSGLFFNERFRANYLAVGIAGIIATVSTYYLMQDVSGRLFGVKSDRPLYVVKYEPTDGPFTKKTLDEINSYGLANVCSKQCDGSDFTMFHLPVEGSIGFTRGVFLVVTGDQGFCGSGGCSDMIVLLEEKKRPVVLYEGQGTTDRLAMIIAREALQQFAKNAPH